MAKLREWIIRLWETLRPRRDDHDLEAELRLHLELAEQDGRRRADSPEGSARAARIRAGGTAQAMEALRDQHSLPWVRDLGRDVRYGCRTLRRNPGFTVVAVTTLALGLGANTAIYQLFDAVRLRALSVENPQHLVIVDLADRTRWTGRRSTGYPALTNPLWEQLRDHQHPFASVLAWANTDLRLDQEGGSQTAQGVFVSGEFFNVLGVEPALGRVFTEADDRRGCGLPGVVLSHGFWQRQFGGNPRVLGRTVALNFQQVEIVGVTPASFTGLEIGRSYDVAIPICSHETLGNEAGWLDNSTMWWLTVMGRVAPDRSLETVNAQLRAISPGLFEGTLPSNYSPEDVSAYLSFTLRTIPGRTGVSALRTRYGNPLLILLITTGLVLLLACTNLANLILARSAARERELAVRLAMGASRGRLMRQLMVEVGLLALGAAVAGVVLAGLLSRFLIGFLGTGLSLELPLDSRLVGFITSVAGLIWTFGLVPAWRSTGVGTLDAVKTGGRGFYSSRESFGLRQVLVVSQVALSLVLLFGALLFAGTMRNLLAVDAGFEANGVIVARVDFSRVEVAEASQLAFKRKLLDRIRNTPGVRAASEVRHVPLGGTGSSVRVWRGGTDSRERRMVRVNAMTDGYLDTMGIGLIAGRDFTSRDTGSSPKVAMVNQSFARQLGLESNPVGQRFLAQSGPSAPETVFEIIGLIPDTKYFTLREDFLPIVFVPLAQIGDPRPFTDFMIRAQASVGSSAIRRAVDDVSPRLGTDLRPFDAHVQNGLLRERLLATLSGLLGALAALIAAIGLYGLMSYVVVRRTNEIGLRMALGARRGEILAMLLRRTAVLVGIGLAVGVTGALATASLAESLVFGLQPHGLWPVVLACALLATVAAAASYVPARRATKVDPLIALRSE